MPKAVIFVPSTENSTLAKEIRSVITQLKPWTGISLKVVERAGEKLEEALHKSDPWENRDCNRPTCKPCKSAYKDEKMRFGNCKRRSVIYRVWCATCKRKLEENDIAKELEGEKKRKLENNTENREKTYTYVGETSRSAFERGEEHDKDLELCRVRSHMLRHVVEQHEGESIGEIDFRMEIVSSHRSAFERQVREAVMIERLDENYSLNSKLEYSRTVIPKIKIKMGNKEEKENPLVTKEKNSKEKISELKSILVKRKVAQRRKEHGETVDKNEIIRSKKLKMMYPENLNENGPKSDKNTPKVTKNDRQNTVKLDDLKVTEISQLSNKPTVAKAYCSNVSSLWSDSFNITTRSCSKIIHNSPNKSDKSNIAPACCSEISTSTNKSDNSNIAREYCSQINSSNIYQSDNSNLATDCCSNVSNIPNSDLEIPNKSDNSTLATDCCSNVSNNPNSDSKITYQSDNSNVASDCCSNVSNSTKINSSGQLPPSVAIETRADIKYLSQVQPIIKSTGAIPKLSKRTNSVKGRQPRILDDYDGLNTLNNSNSKFDFISTIAPKYSEMPEGKQTSSPKSDRWRGRSLGVKAKIKYFEVFNRHKSKSPKSKSDSKLKCSHSSKKSGPKTPKIAVKTGGDIRRFFARESFSPIKSSPVKRLQSGFVNSNRKVTITRPLKSTGQTLSDKNSSKLSGVISNIEENVILAQNRAISESDSDRFANGGRVEKLKSAFEILMSKNVGDTARKTPGKGRRKHPK